MKRSSLLNLSDAQIVIVREAAKIDRDVKRAERRAAKAQKKERAKAQNIDVARAALAGIEARFRQPRAVDAEYMSWLHDGIPCIACLIEGEPDTRGLPNPIEAAHQKLNIADKGWKKVSGVRTHDHQCVPLCAWHHQHAPNACDKGQRHFWDRLAIGDLIADLCAELYAAFKGGQPGAPIVLRYARTALAELTAARNAGLRKVNP